uniref:DOMON domain-containing protein n=1 Tax=Panagrolaimus sp. ES5 TaxID=591445 RepID=A0AC34F148_9BILA
MISHAPSSDGKSVILEIYGKRETAEMQYVAAGFSQDDLMGGEPVVARVANPNGNTFLAYSNNEGHQNLPNFGVDKFDGELLEVESTDLIIYCKVKQAVTPTNEALPNLASNYRILVARGPVLDNGGKLELCNMLRNNSNLSKFFECEMNSNFQLSFGLPSEEITVGTPTPSEVSPVSHDLIVREPDDTDSGQDIRNRIQTKLDGPNVQPTTECEECMWDKCKNVIQKAPLWIKKAFCDDLL